MPDRSYASGASQGAAGGASRRETPDQHGLFAGHEVRLVGECKEKGRPNISGKARDRALDAPLKLAVCSALGELIVCIR
eukprot:CAMPEP_0119410354 /NCGR_PEP_ID=MMETSP1335-20130426/3400_1 /TAXON_ID=259385 /ORGANISM="Chrysoculter rhomboideus, Strain RCC1486" /LENGTH=78 /DNA_ID=CAMNT_0007434861 /DNA_START=45 /DNA_END=279 /DNA_ORIENTATION=-